MAGEAPSPEAAHDDGRHGTSSPVGDDNSEDTDSAPNQLMSSKDVVIRDLEKFPSGYPNLAAFADSHESFMVYRRFGYFQARVLLEKQDELRELEEQLDDIDHDDSKDDFDRLVRREK